MEKHQLAQKIIKILIESGLSIDDQLEVLKKTREKVEFCKLAGIKANQLKIEYEANK